MIVVLRESVWNAADDVDDTINTLSINTRLFTEQQLNVDDPLKTNAANSSHLEKNLNTNSPQAERSLGPLQFNVNISPRSTTH